MTIFNSGNNDFAMKNAFSNTVDTFLRMKNNEWIKCDGFFIIKKD